MTMGQSTTTEQSIYRYILYQYVSPCLAALAIIFNMMEIWYIRCSRYSRKNPIGVVYIMNLALSDIFVGLMMIILKTMNAFMTTSLKGNLVAAEIYSIIRLCLVRFSLLLSVCNLVALTLDRVWVMRNLFRQQINRKSVSVKICVAIWMTSLVSMSVFYGVLCLYFNEDVEIYKNVFMPVVTYPATILFVVSYWLIFDVVKKTGKVISRNSLEIKDKRKKNKMMIDITSEEAEFLKLSIKTVLTFVVCWMPLSTISIIKLFTKNYGGQELMSTFFTLALANSAITPFLYYRHLWKAIMATWRQWSATNIDKNKRRRRQKTSLMEAFRIQDASTSKTFSAVSSTTNTNIPQIKITEQ